MYRDLQESYWWPGLQREVTDFVARCLTCQQVKAKHQLLSGLLQLVKIPLLKWERKKLHEALSLRLDFSTAFYPQTDSQSERMAPYEALYDRKYRTPLCWTELGERQVLGPKLVSETKDKVRLIRDHLIAASDRQKSYADQKSKNIEFTVGDLVFLKVSP
ncbi:uncharacterized protein [Gossypium hirsutum]|uniref:Integrase zinc-binding domain-containing protein n=1 Tax=Gossypium hirsutum TaxID=3635 RepID=A0ABM3ASW6_GOSHI|nr:uncharacterized protein LOC121222084 [Gossypium hirsutum]